ncbi:MAG: VWA domain-containing protein [Desulfovibrio sp.]|uniref:cobaltochelatase CobT-related protein n=1 Tax=Desulfovibrio sp. TaxID=885 RepID=UPI001A6A8A06|nr:VWA domain-containing protein [Desulfovibrio sp.]MBD5416518.1 VWA domain-containing protein [Desulfovibrio sp.]
MIRNRDVLNSLPMLASVLGDQYGIEVRIGGSEAKTDGKTIYLPSLPLECDRDLLALARGYLDHEAAHIRQTDFKAVKTARMNPVTFNFFNTIEDWRIEQRLAAIFPGCRQNLHWLIRRLFLEDKRDKSSGEAAQSSALLILKYVLLTVRAWDVPELWGRVSEIGQSLDQLFPGLRAQMDDILKDVQTSCPDTKSAIAYAQQLAACLQDWQTQNSEEQQDRPPDENQPAGRGTGNQQDHGKTFQSQEDGTEKEGEENGGPPESASDVQQAGSVDKAATVSPKKASEELGSLFVMDSAQLPKGTGEHVSESLEEQACKNQGDGINVAIRGRMHLEPLSPEDKLEALQASIALRTRFSSLLQIQTQRRCQPARKGHLNPTNLYRLSIGNPKAFQKEGTHTGLDTAVHVLLDASGSMRGEPMRLASLACYAVGKALEHAKGISVGITAFPAFSAQSEAVFPIMEHGQPLTDNFQISADYDTPLAEALWWTLQVLVKRQERRKLLLILTDGQPNTWEPSVEALRQITRVGIEVYGVGLSDCNIEKLLPGRSKIIHKLTELAPVMFDFLQRSIMRRNDG